MEKKCNDWRTTRISSRPLAFLVLINDLPLSVKYSNTILFADDTAIYYSGKNCNEIQNTMSENLALVKKWLNDH